MRVLHAVAVLHDFIDTGSVPLDQFLCASHRALIKAKVSHSPDLRGLMCHEQRKPMSLWHIEQRCWGQILEIPFWKKLVEVGNEKRKKKDGLVVLIEETRIAGRTKPIISTYATIIGSAGKRWARQRRQPQNHK